MDDLRDPILKPRTIEAAGRTWEEYPRGCWHPTTGPKVCRTYQSVINAHGDHVVNLMWREHPWILRWARVRDGVEVLAWRLWIARYWRKTP